MYDSIGKLNLLPIKVDFKSDSMVNIVSMKSVTGIKGAKVTMNTAIDKGIVLTLGDGPIIKFSPYENGWYYYDTAKVNNNKPKDTVTDYSLIQTVKENKNYFSAREIK